ncbi:putative gamma-butyrobetaine dioxygenase [Diaporthe ampelina]|uniref:Putative gamma-butyrobetaine dioxygenase n=1 Tax=Diaporthe ampelina TaxID=1214573 RepID=A0A0G2HMM3_9PEZI|nr:putative gamma-butyrobetaine dioxygenase [Diaporthe ampelina]
MEAPHGSISLEFEKLHAPVTLAQLWLRDACQCHLCVGESSGQKRFATCDIPSDLKVDSLRVLEDGGLEVSWANDLALGSDQHVSTYPLALLHDMLLARDPYRRNISAREIWDLQHFDKDSRSREISYSHWMEDGSRFAEAFCDLHRWGLVVIRGVPQTEDAVEQVASRLGHLQATFYGPTWDVVSKPQAENVAYTNEFLCLHQDLMYLREPPRIQVLHCLENGCEGGDSLFSDGLRAAHDLRLNNEDHFKTLATSSVDFHYAKGGHYWHNKHNTIVVDRPFGKARPLMKKYLMSVRWSPPFQAPFWKTLQRRSHGHPWDVRAGFMIERWHQAAKVFRDSTDDPTNMVQFRLQPGDCVVFDNWRVLHGRREFDTASGRRHLRGAYVENQALNSTWVRLQREGLMFPDEPEAFEEENRRARRIVGVEDDAKHVGLSDGEAQA